MRAIRGTFDGTQIQPLPDEPVPEVSGQVPVAIVFLDDDLADNGKAQRQKDLIQRMRAARDTMPPLGVSVKDLVEQGHEQAPGSSLTLAWR